VGRSDVDNVEYCYYGRNLDKVRGVERRMMTIKCIGCYELLRDEMVTSQGTQVVYNCPEFFPYWTAVSGLIRPRKGITRAVDKCPKVLGKTCLFCGEPTESWLGFEMLATCLKHYEEWSRWLDEHPDRRSYLAPLRRVRQDHWIEVFREFVEDM